jgi:hypothetical protein
MVSGEICEPPVPPPLLPVEVEAWELEKKSNELDWLMPVDFADDDFEDVSA